MQPKRGRPTAREIEQREHPERLLTLVGVIELSHMGGIGRLFKLLKSYRLDGCTKVRIYVRRID